MNLIFVLSAAVLIALAWLFVLPALWGRAGRAALDPRERLRLLYQGRMQEIEGELESDVLGMGQLQQARREVEREMLALVPEESVQPRPPHRLQGLRWFIALAVPLIAVGSFLLVQPSSVPLQTAADAPAAADGDLPSVAEMVGQLRTRLEQSPEDLRGWQLLGRSLNVLGRYPEAVEAYERANVLSGFGNPELLVAYAEALAYAAGRQVDARAEALLLQALQLDPAQPKALWLAGWARYQARDYPAAIAYWETLRSRVSPEQELHKLISGHIDEATGLQRATGAPAAAPDGIGLDVTVRLAPEFVGLVAAEDTVFVIARTEEGLRAPLAVLRRKAGELPFTVRLDDSLAMLPTHKLSGAQNVVITARVSRSGETMARSGDLQGMSGVLRVGEVPATEVTLDRALP